MNGDTRFDLKDNSGNPAPVGLLAFGMTTVLLNLHNAGVYELNSMILAMGIFYGGLAQVVVGIMEWKKNNTFGFTAFTSYGFFWLTLVALLVMPRIGWADKTSDTGLACYLALWGVFTAFLLIGTFKISKALQVVFATLTLLFFLLAVSFAGGSPGLRQFAGGEGLVCGASAMYAGFAQVLNETFGKIVLPLGVMKK